MRVSTSVIECASPLVGVFQAKKALADVPHGDVAAKNAAAELLAEKEEVWRAVHPRPGYKPMYSSSLRSAERIPTHPIQDPTCPPDSRLSSLYPAEQHPRMLVEPVNLLEFRQDTFDCFSVAVQKSGNPCRGPGAR